MIRLFVAIDLPAELCAELEQIQRRIADANILEGSFAKPAQLHITLKFIGEVDEKLVPEIIQRLKSISMPAFTTRLHQLGTFNKHNREPIIWISVEQNNVAMLAEFIENALADILPRTKQAFTAHVTLVRAKKVLDEEKFQTFMRDFKLEPQLPFWINEFVLKSSLTLPEGAEHTTLECFQLGR